MIIYDSPLSTLVQLEFNFAVYVFFILSAFKGRLSHSKRRQSMIVLGYLVVSTVVIMLFLVNHSPFWRYRYIALTLWITGTIISCILLFKSNLLQLLFLIFVAMDAQLGIMQLARVVYNIFVKAQLISQGDVQLFIVNVFVNALCIPLLWHLFITLFHKVVQANVDKMYWRHIYIIPISSYALRVFSFANFQFHDKNNLAINLLVLILLNICGYFAYVAVLQMLQKTGENIQAMQSAALMQKQILIQEEQFKKLAENIELAERQRHDMRHHFVAIKGCLNNKDYGEAYAYLDNCIDAANANDEPTICENKIIDTLLRHYVAPAKAAGIKVETEVCISPRFTMPSTELCVVFGNLVENAYEACCRQKAGDRYISIQAEQVHDKLLCLKVCNSCGDGIKQRGMGFMSQKHSGEGIGTWSVRNISEKSGGTCQYSCENNVFKAQILLAI